MDIQSQDINNAANRLNIAVKSPEFYNRCGSILCIKLEKDIPELHNEDAGTGQAFDEHQPLPQ